MAERVGQVLSVLETPLSATLTASVSVGGSVLTVDDVADFEETGGWLSLNGTVYQYASTDDAANTISLAGTATATAAVGDVAMAWDHDHGRTLTSTKASISCPEGTVSAAVPPELAPFVSQVMRGGASESVNINHPPGNPDAWEIVSLNKPQGVDGVTPLYGGFTTRAYDGTGYGFELDPTGFNAYESDGFNNVVISNNTLSGAPVQVLQSGTSDEVKIGLPLSSGKLSVAVGSTSDVAGIAGDAAGNLYLIGWSVHIKDQSESSYRAINASAFNVSSDRSIKTAFADPGDALAMLRQMPVYLYAMKSDPTVQHFGVMADDAPEQLVSEGAEGLRMVSLYDLVGVLAAAVQQLDAQVNPTATRKSRDLEETP